MARHKKLKTNKPKATKAVANNQPNSHITDSGPASSTNIPPAARSTFDPTNHLPFPPEIRNRIHRHLLHIPNCFIGTPMHPSHYPRTLNPHPLDLSILLVSKQTYLEAFHILYSHNTFTFNTIDVLLKFLRQIGYARRQHVVSVVFRWESDDPKAAFRLLKTCSRLKSIDFNLCYFQPNGLAALREVRGLEKVEIYHRQLALYKFMGVLNPYYVGKMHLAIAQLSELKEAMMRPRLKQYEPKEIDLFDPKTEHFRKGEEHSLGWNRNGIHTRSS